MTTKQGEWRDDIRYMAKLVDWAAGQGFCQIEGMENDPDPEEFMCDLWNRLDGGDGYSAEALGDALIRDIGGEWRGIDSAPRDGAMVMVFGRYPEGPYMALVRWFDGYWQSATQCMGGHKLIEEQPTHWMPLPTPPQGHGEK